MYSDKGIARRQAAVEKSIGTPLLRHEPAVIEETVARLDDLLDPKGNPTRPLTKDEQAFVTNERRLVKIDFHHWLANYCYVIR